MPYRLLILPLGDIEEDVLEHIRKTLKETFGADTSILPAGETPFFALSSFRNQFSAPAIIRRLAPTVRDKNAKLIGVTSGDLFAPRTNFVFGEAQIAGPVAVVSLYRLTDKDKAKYIGRAGKEAVHEIGHTLGLDHCKNSDCVMRFSHNLSDADAKSQSFCDKDEKQVKKAIAGEKGTAS